MEISLIQKVLKQGDCFLDIGANVGYYSFVASGLVGDAGRVIAFEPVPKNLAAIRKNIDANAIANIDLQPVAVGAKAGSLMLYLGDDSLGNSGWASIFSSEKRTTGLEVEMVALDDFVRQNNVPKIRLIKMDIEGSEPDALKGGQAMFSQPNAPDILCEVNPYLLGLGKNNSTLLTGLLAGFGYHLFQADDLSPVDPGRVITNLTNLYCTKNPDQAGSLRND